MFFPYQKLLDYSGNRYALARACMEYARKVKYLASDDCKKVDGKDALVALKHVLEKEVLFTSEKNEIELELGKDSIIFNQKKYSEDGEVEDDSKDIPQENAKEDSTKDSSLPQ